MIPRQIADSMLDAFRKYPVITVTGPRQSGKTTLCKHIFDLPHVNLEAPDQRQFAQQDPRDFLSGFPDGAIIDEVQRVPELTSYIQVLVDESGRPGQYVLTGSSDFSIRAATSQSLAGRTALFTLLPLSLAELSSGGVENLDLDKMLLHGGYPRIHDRKLVPTSFYRDYVGTYVERDLRQLSMVRDLAQFQIFMQLCASNVGRILNLNRLGSDCGISQATAREWLNLLEASYVVFRLSPFHANTRKRLVKSPKLYFHDVGIAAFLLGISATEHLRTHPLRGGLFENLVVTEVIKTVFNHDRRPEACFYRDSNGNEVDLMLRTGTGWLPIEIKAGKTVNQDYFKGFRQLDGVLAMPEGKLLVYGGNAPHTRRDVKIATVGQIAGHVAQFLGCPSVATGNASD
ncbi:MAG: ATP-binding protein [Gammaproteobacteria bacterium]|nr:ATP-binding protein [Gammaproteobacteria bacterium]MYD75900.1 ATP-binding protein [Gammaproteobacteria bacterium]